MNYEDLDQKTKESLQRGLAQAKAGELIDYRESKMIITELITALNNIKKEHPGFKMGKITLPPLSYDILLNELKTYSQKEHIESGVTLNCFRAYNDKLFYFSHAGKFKFVKGKQDD